MTDFLLLTCEHGGNRIPAEYRRLFHGRKRLLDSHRGYDPGALDLAQTCARRLRVPLHFATVSRLLVELNRSIGHPALFSVVTKALPPAERETILRTHYFPYRNQVETEIVTAISQGRRVIHLSLHTFTPKLDGEVRRADIGLLYDPARPGERDFCKTLKALLAVRRPDLAIRKNYPYFGKSDGFTTSLRKKFNALQYLGIEIEVNQRWYFGDRREWRRLQHDIAEAIATGCRC